MGTVAAERFDVTRYARDVAESLAEATGESAFFSARRQSETICLVRVEGSFPIRSFVLVRRCPVPAGSGLRRVGHPGAPARSWRSEHYLDRRPT